MKRFRLREACTIWVEREGCHAIKDYMASLIGPTCSGHNGKPIGLVYIRTAGNILEQ